MMHKIIPMGCCGYIKNRRVYTLVRTVIYFLLCTGLYLMGYLTNGTNKNLLTVVAVLGCLPACKSLVNFIIFMRAAGCSELLRDKVQVYDEGLITFYDMYFTSYQKNYPVSHMSMKGNVLCGITENPKCDEGEAEKHLEQMLVQEGIKNMTVKIYSNADKYIDRLSQLMKLEVPEQKNQEKIKDLLYSISL